MTTGGTSVLRSRTASAVGQVRGRWAAGITAMGQGSKRACRPAGKMALLEGQGALLETPDHPLRGFKLKSARFVFAHSAKALCVLALLGMHAVSVCSCPQRARLCFSIDWCLMMTLRNPAHHSSGTSFQRGVPSLPTDHFDEFRLQQAASGSMRHPLTALII